MRPTLLYRATCGKCRVLSAAAVALTLGLVRRVPLASPEALGLYERHRVRPGKLALVTGRGMRTGWRVVYGIALLPLLLVFEALTGGGLEQRGGGA
jgi:hypothetical protein